MAELSRVAIVAGEASGDILGAGLVAHLKKRYPNCVFEGIGGELMINEGFETLYPLDRLSVMGLVEPLKRLPELLSIRRSLKKRFIENPPDVFIGIDSPDFNLSLEEALRKKKILTVHYVSPSVWAWRQGRVKKIARAVDLMLALFPFEADFYRHHDVEVSCVGHTLADTIPLHNDKNHARRELSLKEVEGLRYVALLPGSRASEVRYLCEPFLRAAELCLVQDERLMFLLPAANAGRKSEIEEVLREYPHLPVALVQGRSQTVMAAADAVLMASGTTTLEALLLKRPMVIAYKMASVSYSILARLVKSPFIGLPNLLAGKALVTELIQHDATPENLAKEIMSLLDSQEKRDSMLEAFSSIHLSLKKDASRSASDAVIRLVASRHSELQRADVKKNIN